MNENIIRASLVVGGIAVGGGAGYFLAKHQLRNHYQAQAEEQVAQVKAHYDRRYKEGAFATPAGAVEALVVGDEPAKEKRDPRALVEDILGREGYIGQAKVEETEDGLIVEIEKPESAANIFTTSPGDLDLDEDGVPWDLGLPERQSDEPYIIHIDEYMASEFDQVSLTYFVGDNTLIDENEHLVEDVEGLVGQTHMGMFGRGSSDENIIYIRNEVIMTDFEVTQSESTYAEAVLGMRPDELEEPAPRKKKPKRDERDD